MEHADLYILKKVSPQLEVLLKKHDRLELRQILHQYLNPMNLNPQLYNSYQYLETSTKLLYNW